MADLFDVQRVITVSQLNRRVLEVIEQSLPLTWVAGEISNFTRAASGHCYFSLKDDAAQVRCVMFRHKMQYLDWAPGNGMQVEVRALPTLYETRGEFQLNVEVMRRAGMGALYEAFARLKARLEGEGLFDAARKRPLPRYPRVIGVVTSPQAAALRDVLTTLRRRMPGIVVVIYPTPVQGEGAGAQIAAAIRSASTRGECDVIIVCRGGGSLEDLWAFNDEAVARAIASASMPVVSGVGHETDFTIADFVADARAPTPTAAAELVSPDRVDLMHKLAAWQVRLGRHCARGLEARMQHLDHLGRRLQHPAARLAAQAQHLQHLRSRMRSAWAGRFAMARQQLQMGLGLKVLLSRQMLLRQGALERLSASLHHLNPYAVLERGYSIVATENGEIVRDSASLRSGEILALTFAHGNAKAKVT
ncbi:MAG: exodeoxyribonuclease VII large subunit [Pseudomonadota bacterium]